MTFLCRLVDKIKGIFAPKTATVAEPASATVVSPEPIQPIVITAAGNPVPPVAAKQEPVLEAAPAPTKLVIEHGAYRPTVSGPKDPPTLQQPAPVIEIKTEPKAEEKPQETPKKPPAKKEAGKAKPAREEKPKKEKKPSKRALPKAK